MDVKSPLNPPSRPLLQVIELLGDKRSSLIEMVGQIVKATVISSELLRPDNKPVLQTKPSLPLPSQTTSNEIKAASTQVQLQHSEQRQFNVVLKIGATEIPVISDKPLSAGTQISLKVMPGGQLQLNQAIVPETKSQPSLMQTSLREILPHQQSYQPLLNGLLKIPAPIREILTPQIQHKITELLQNLPTKEQIQKPQGLKTAIQNSGIFLEAKLLKSAIEQKPELKNFIDNTRTAQTAIKEHPSIPPENRQQILSMIQRLIRQQNLSVEVKPTSPKQVAPETRQAIQSDFKGDIARLVRTISETPQGYSIPPLNPLTNLLVSTSPEKADLGILLRSMAQIIKHQSASSTQPTSDTPLSKEQQASLIQTLQRQALTVLARTQLHQLTSLNAQAAPAAENPAINNWIIELPFLNNNQVDTVNIEISEEEASEKQDDSNERQWKVMLGFELDDLGSIYVQLILISDTVSATIWAEQQETFIRVKSEVDSLRSSLTELGVKVKQLDCHVGSPPDPNTRFEQQLIDIHT